MDREILFRGKRADNGEWVEGYYAVIGKRNVIIALPEMYYTEDAEERYGNEIHDIVPETVGRYTGLADKNRRKIFEGDIIKYSKKLFKTVWVQGCAHFAAHPMERLSWSPCMNVSTVKAAEVVGNIFDNPELLEGGAE